MNIFKKFFTKKVEVPETNEVKEVEAIQLWFVRWYSRSGSFSSDMRKEMEAFSSEEAAEEFAESLRAAFKLIRHTSGNRVTVEKN